MNGSRIISLDSSSSTEKENNAKNLFFEKKTKISYGLSILVFLIHCSTFANYTVDSSVIRFISVFFQDIITPVAVPLFFIISGATFFRDYNNAKYAEKIKRRILSLGIPFIAWNTINMLFDIVATMWFSKYFIRRKPFIFSPWSFFVSIFHYQHNGPFWFVFALIIFSLCAPLISLIIRNKWIGFGVIVILTILAQFGIGLPCPFFLTQDCIVYYLIGAVIGKHYFSWFSQEHKMNETIVSIVAVILSWGYFILVFYEMLPNLLSVKVIVLTLFSFGVWIGSDLFFKKIPVRDYMSRSFWVFALHENVSAVITKVLYILLPKNEIFALINFVCTIIFTLIVIEIICKLMMHFFPRVAAKLSGGR